MQSKKRVFYKDYFSISTHVEKLGVGKLKNP
jgi:hypothetical protein